MGYERIIAKRIREVPPSGIRKFFDIASEMKDIISLGIGEPDFVTPENIRRAAIKSLEAGETHYTSNHGFPELRELIAKYLKTRYGVEYPKADILITVGASEAIDLVFRAITEPGDEILVPAPSYVSYMPGVIFAGGTPVCIKTLAKDKFKITPEGLERVITPKTKAIVIPYPNNPTGAIMEKEDYEAIRDIIIKNDLFVISDEIYSELTYGDKVHYSIAQMDGMYERTVLINGFSKAFAMTGFRLGYACGAKPILDTMTKIHQYSILCAPTPSQFAGIEALRTEMDTGFAQVLAMKESYDERRNIIYAAFDQIGMNSFEPLGAFYIFPCIKLTGLSSEEFCQRLIYEKRVACVPGTAFGEGGEGFIRCSYASSKENIKEAMNRIAEFVRECQK